MITLWILNMFYPPGPPLNALVIFRWYTRPIHGFAPTVWIWWTASGIQLPLFRRLCGQRFVASDLCPVYFVSVCMGYSITRVLSQPPLSPLFFVPPWKPINFCFHTLDFIESMLTLVGGLYQISFTQYIELNLDIILIASF